MRAEPILFKEFDYKAVSVKKRTSSLLPGGRTKGEVPPPPPTFSEEQLKTAEKEAFKKGFLEGTEEGKRQQKDAEADTQEALRQTLMDVCSRFTPLVDNYKQQIAGLRVNMPKLALAAAKKAAGKALNDHAATHLNDIVERCLKSLPDEPEIAITIHESLSESLKKHIETLGQGYPVAKNITVTPNKDMPAGNCMIGWKDGSFLRDTGQIWLQLDQAIEQIAAGESFAVKQQMDRLPETAEPKQAAAEAPAAPANEQPQPPEGEKPAGTDDQPPAKE